MKKRIIAWLLIGMLLISACAEAEQVKKERVYVVADTAGEVQTIIDNIQLSNPNQSDQIIDQTHLQDIENVGGHETFELEGETLIWNAEGHAIHYQGKGVSPVAVVPVVQYEMNGEEISDESLENGQITIRVSFKENTAFPVLALTVLPVPDGWKDISLENAILFDEGDLQFILGFTVPGADNTFGLPDSFSVTCDAENIDLKWMFTIATADPTKMICDHAGDYVQNAEELLNNLITVLTALQNDTEIPEFEGDFGKVAAVLAEALNGINALADGADQIKTGTAALANGAGQIKTVAASISTSTSTLKDNIITLGTNLSALTAKNRSLNTTAKQLFTQLISDANFRISISNLNDFGIMLPELTAENYTDELDNAIQQLNTFIEQENEESKEAVIAPAQAALSMLTDLKDSLVQADDFANDLESYTKGVSQAQNSNAALQISTALLANIASTLASGTETLNDGANELSAGTVALSDGMNQLKSGIDTAIASVVDTLLPILTDDAPNYIDALKRTVENTSSSGSYDLLPDHMNSETLYIIRTDF